MNNFPKTIQIINLFIFSSIIYFGIYKNYPFAQYIIYAVNSIIVVGLACSSVLWLMLKEKDIETVSVKELLKKLPSSLIKCYIKCFYCITLATCGWYFTGILGFVSLFFYNYIENNQPAFKKLEEEYWKNRI